MNQLVEVKEDEVSRLVDSDLPDWLAAACSGARVVLSEPDARAASEAWPIVLSETSRPVNASLARYPLGALGGVHVGAYYLPPPPAGDLDPVTKKFPGEGEEETEVPTWYGDAARGVAGGTVAFGFLLEEPCHRVEVEAWGSVVIESLSVGHRSAPLASGALLRDAEWYVPGRKGDEIRVTLRYV